MDLNKVQLIGRLGGAAELREVNGGRVAGLRLANRREWRDAAGERQEVTDWYNLTAWNGLAEVCERLCRTGDLVYVEGRLRVSQWEDRDGTRRTRVEVVLDPLQLLARARPRPRDEAGAPEPEEEVPFSYCAPEMARRFPSAFGWRVAVGAQPRHPPSEPATDVKTAVRATCTTACPSAWGG